MMSFNSMRRPSPKEQDPQIKQEQERGADPPVPMANLNTRRREAVWQLALDKGVMKPWLVRYLYPIDVMDVERRAQQQKA